MPIGVRREMHKLLDAACMRQKSCVRARVHACTSVCVRVHACTVACQRIVCSRALPRALSHSRTLSLALSCPPAPPPPRLYPPQGIRRTDQYAHWQFPPLLELWRFVRKSLQSAEKQRAMLQRAIVQMRVLTQVCIIVVVVVVVLESSSSRE